MRIESKDRASLLAETGLSYREQQHARDALRTRGLLEERYIRLKHRFYLRVNLEGYNILIERMVSLVETGGLEEVGEDPQATKRDFPKVQNVTSGDDKWGNPEAPTTQVHVESESTAETTCRQCGGANTSPRSVSASATAAVAPPVESPPPPLLERPAKRPRKLPLRQQPGELHPELIALISSMKVTAFHCLAEPNKLVERFWDAQIDLLKSVGGLGLRQIIRECDAWFMARPKKWPFPVDGAMRRMAYSVQYQLEQAQRRAVR